MQPQNLQMYAPTLVQPGHVYNQFQQQNKPIRITDFRNAQQNMQIHSPIPGQAGSAHGQTSYGQQIYAPAPAQFGNGYVQTQAPDHATFHTTTFGQVLQNQQVPAAAPVYYSGLQPLNAPKNFMIPSELDSWQQQQKVDEFALQQPKQDIASYGQEKNAAHQEQKSKGQGADFQHFQAYGKKFTDPSEVTAWQQQEVAEKIGSQGHNQGVTPHQQKEIEAALQRRKDSEIALQRQRENEAIRRQNKQKEKEKERENEKEASIQQQRPTRAAASFQQTKQKSDPSNSEVLDYHLSARYSLGPYVGVGFLSPTLTQDHSSILTPEKLQERDTRRAKLHKILFSMLPRVSLHL
ncbi:hypothetical protein N431DRAFT_19289 [Stipitochalara longipes BDJ]|nr:hypothetical protein N431DRAFT_19289 [Stipitochalara longipes BDJ]